MALTGWNCGVVILALRYASPWSPPAAPALEGHMQHVMVMKGRHLPDKRFMPALDHAQNKGLLRALYGVKSAGAKEE